MFFLFFIPLQPNSISYKKNKHQGKMRRTVSTLLLLLFVVIAEAQNLTGKVIDSKTQEAIIGATVTLKGSKKNSDSHGYQWSVPFEQYDRRKYHTYQLCGIQVFGCAIS